MDFRIISLPSFQAVTSGVAKEFDFSPEGILGKFNAYFSAMQPLPKDNFMPRDFLFYDKEQGGLVWWWALAEGMDTSGYDVIDFDGGYYLTYIYKDGDEEANAALYKKALEYINSSDFITLDERPNHYSMGHIITPPEIIKLQGWAQMECFIPIKVLE